MLILIMPLLATLSVLLAKRLLKLAAPQKEVIPLKARMLAFTLSKPGKSISGTIVCPRTTMLVPMLQDLGVSRDSVLQSGTSSRCVTLGLLKKAITETEPHRCKRTDGKKWRCSKDAVPGRKYCDVHMHRGAKRIIMDSELVSVAPSTSRIMPKGSSHISINLNAKPESPQEFTENKSTSSSDATTITDENWQV
ncbi:Growth-regulating factor [Abeliophyllum distichum]|uniref:Growth-regulating factor n=1 Tax=Abeliophyllum distichum TaxID=126358 RepID=A0ABD1PA52_9LAMI